MPLADRALGKLVVELTQQANSLVSPFILDNLQPDVLTSFGVPFVDAALALLAVQFITRLYGDVELVDGVSPALVDRMRATYVLRFSDDTDLDFVMFLPGATSGFANVEAVGVHPGSSKTERPLLHRFAAAQESMGSVQDPGARGMGSPDGSNLVNTTVIVSGRDKNHPDLARQPPFIEFAYVRSPLTQTYPYQVFSRKESA